jgi:hypothetical protein
MVRGCRSKCGSASEARSKPTRGRSVACTLRRWGATLARNPYTACKRPEGWLERLVQGDCAAPQRLRLGRRRRGRCGETATQHQGYVAQPGFQWLGRGRRAGSGIGTPPQHHICVDRPQKQSPRRGRRAGAGRDTAPQHNAHVAGPQRLWRGRGSPGRGSTVQYFVRPGATWRGRWGFLVI